MTTTTMTPVDWAKRPIQKYAVFSGRAPRSEFWWYCLLVFLALIVAMIVESAVGLTAILYPYGPLTILILLATFIPGLAVQVRRLARQEPIGALASRFLCSLYWVASDHAWSFWPCGRRTRFGFGGNGGITFTRRFGDRYRAPGLFHLARNAG